MMIARESGRETKRNDISGTLREREIERDDVTLRL